MFDVKIGPTTTEVEAPLLEETAEIVARTEVHVENLADQIEALTEAVLGAPHIEFIIGPIRERS